MFGLKIITEKTFEDLWWYKENYDRTIGAKNSKKQEIVDNIEVGKWYVMNWSSSGYNDKYKTTEVIDISCDKEAVQVRFHGLDITTSITSKSEEWLSKSEIFDRLLDEICDSDLEKPIKDLR